MKVRRADELEGGMTNTSKRASAKADGENSDKKGDWTEEGDPAAADTAVPFATAGMVEARTKGAGAASSGGGGGEHGALGSAA